MELLIDDGGRSLPAVATVPAPGGLG